MEAQKIVNLLSDSEELNLKFATSKCTLLTIKIIDNMAKEIRTIRL